MPEFKLTINDPKSGKSYQKSVDTTIFREKKIREIIKADPIGIPGYELQITGGSDKEGFPMRTDMPGVGRRKALLTSGPGVHIKRKGIKRRKAVRGNTISLDTSQINLKITKYGAKTVEELFGIKKEAAEKEKVEEAPKKEEPTKKKIERPKEQIKAEEKKIEAKESSSKKEKGEDKNTSEKKNEEI